MSAEFSSQESSALPSFKIVEIIAKNCYPNMIEKPMLLEQSFGMDNFLYRCDTKEGSQLLRVSSSEHAAKVHQKELTVSKIALEHGVDTIAYDFLGSYEQWSYISRPFINSICPPPLESIDSCWEFIGVSAKKTHSIEQDFCGINFLSADPLQDSFAHWLAEQLRILEADTSLLEQKVLSSKTKIQALEIVSQLSNWSFTPALCHGDLSVNNMLYVSVRESKLIDWGNAIAHRAPHFDIAEIAIWNDLDRNNATDWQEGFCRGYGISNKELVDIIDQSIPLQLWRVLYALRRDISTLAKNWRTAKYAALSSRKLIEILTY